MEQCLEIDIKTNWNKMLNQTKEKQTKCKIIIIVISLIIIPSKELDSNSTLCKERNRLNSDGIVPSVRIHKKY